MKLGDVIVVLFGLLAVARGNFKNETVFMGVLDEAWPGYLNASSTLTRKQRDNDSDTASMEDGDTEESDNGITIRKTVCKDGQVYDSEVHDCRQNCTEEETYYAAVQECLSTIDYNTVSTRPLCKNVTINSAEFTMDPNGTVRISTTSMIFIHGTYTNISNGIKVCYPFTREFIKCDQWAIEPCDYERINHGLNIRVLSQNRYYYAGDFYLSLISSAISAVTCIQTPQDPQAVQNLADSLKHYAVAWTISAISIIITIITYLLTKTLKYQVKTLLCHMVSLLVLYTVLMIRYWSEPNRDLCPVYAILLTVSFLASFFWLNVIAYDIWKRLPDYHLQSKNSRSRSTAFLKASLYAWGMPVGITGAAVAVNYLIVNQCNRCWLYSDHARLVFMYVPSALLMAANSVFYVRTVINLRSIGRGAAVVNRRIPQQLFKMYLKLMVVMGLCWIMEIVSAVVGKYGKVWYFTDMINCLQGFFIFVIYVCKRSVLRDIIQKWEKRFGPCICRKFSSIIFSTQPHIHHNQHREARRDNSSSASICPTSDYSMNSTTSTRMSTASAVSN